MGVRILIVEHQESHAEEIKARLKGNGHELVVAGDLENGVAAARRQRPHIILCAVAQPSNGLQLLLKLRVDASFDRVPIVAVTSLSADRTSLLGLGFSGVIAKPLSEEFAGQVEGFLPK